MNKINLVPAHTDDRGVITDLLENKNINAVTVISFETDAVRANHYHKETTQWNYIISGKVKHVAKMLDGEPVEIVMEKGDFVETVPNEYHAFKALEKSEMIVFTQGPRGGKEYESDTYRLDEKLI
ncbi:MAG: cupin domain-containing protein [Bacteriovoracaceae bacterium]|nr:cupin domain-containing protein [Bacteriovoracaceae bacterium]